MTSLRCMAIVSLGIAFCIGCSDSTPQSWERGKSQASGEKTPKVDDIADNDEPSSSGESGNPHKMINPHGANPHGDIPMATSAKDEVLENDGKLDLETAHWTVPKSWNRKAPKMPDIIQAEYGIPKAEGDKVDGRLTISQARGSMEDNIARWKGQFGTKLDKESQETIDSGGVKITLVDLAGSFNDSMGPMGVAHPDYRMLGAIFQIPNEAGLHFIKCYGPAKTITARADEIKGFLNSLKIDK